MAEFMEKQGFFVNKCVGFIIRHGRLFADIAICKF